MKKENKPKILIKNKKNKEIARFEINGDVFIKDRKINVDKELAQLFTYVITDISGFSPEKLLKEITKEVRDKTIGECIDALPEKIKYTKEEIALDKELFEGYCKSFNDGVEFCIERFNENLKNIIK